jgi:hypothetical protein
MAADPTWGGLARDLLALAGLAVAAASCTVLVAYESR